VLIRTFHRNDIDSILDESGIKECKRSIYVFVKKDEYLNGSAKVGRAILVNESLSDGRYTITKLKIPNSANIRITIYYFDVLFNDIKDLRESVFTLTESFGSERVISYTDKKVIDYETSQYSTLVHVADDSTRDWIQLRDATYIPPPKYYNETHMYHKEHDFNSLFGYDTIMYFNMDELMDEFTTIKIFDIDFWDSMDSVIVESIDKQIMKNEYGVGDVSIQLYTQFIQASINDAMFIYDSELGTNIKGGTIPFYKNQIKPAMINDIKNAKSIFEFTCKEIQDKYGSIRVHMKPTIFGDSFNIMCKEYEIDNQPFNIGHNDNNIVSIDRSYPTTNIISEILSNRQLLDIY
jgi:hypothetical protein